MISLQAILHRRVQVSEGQTTSTVKELDTEPMQLKLWLDITGDVQAHKVLSALMRSL